MSKTMKKSTYIFLLGFMVLSIVIVTVLAYGNILNDYFNHPDTTNHLFYYKTDIVKIFSEPWRLGFYRPITSLAYGIDYSIWGLNPFGYNLTGLTLHTLVSVMVFFIMLSLTRNELFIAWLSAVIFAAHPIHMNVLPALVYNRQETIPALFMMLSLLSFMKYASAFYKKQGYLFLSLFFFAIALGAKEIAIITPLLIFTYVIIFADENSFKQKVRIALKIFMPYFFISVVYMTLRTYLLQGLGGYGQHVKNYFSTINQMVRSYYFSLLDPVEITNISFRLGTSILDTIQISHFKLIFVALVFSTFMFFRRQIKDSFKNMTYNEKIVVYLIIWALLPLFVYIATMMHGHMFRFVYIPAIPFCGILSFAVVKSLQSIIKSMKISYLSVIKSSIVFIIALGIICNLFISSPLVRDYREWENAGKITQVVFQKLMEIAPELPDNAVIHMNNLPIRVYPNPKQRISPVSEGLSFADYNYGAFLNYYYPDKNFKLTAKYTVWIIDTDYPLNPDSDMKFEIRKRKDNNIVELDIKLTNDQIEIFQ